MSDKDSNDENNKEKERIIVLKNRECAIILREDRSIDIRFPENFYDHDQVPDHELAFFGAAFALKEPEWVVELYKLALEKTNGTQKANPPTDKFGVN